MQKENDHIIIIGAGIGGLTSALLLSHQGFKVTVIERNEYPGGKLRGISSQEGPIDAGPTVLTLIDVFEDIFSNANLNLFKELDLYKEEILARHYWPDGKCLDLFSSHKKNLASIAKVFGEKSANEFNKFHRDCEALFFAFDKALLKNRTPMSFYTKTDFLKNVKKAINYIRLGDILQVVLSQRWKLEFKNHPFSFYRALRKTNPSPYMFYIKNKNNYIIGASPEVLVRVDKGVVETRPIAGTKPRGKNKLADKNFERDLLKDPKEKAEHIMLVDLARNDMSKVCNYGSVKVTDMMSIERYSHVMHIVSNVKGILNKNNDSIDVFKACFPAGTLSGAPKIRAMQIISELEPNNRGPYGGSVGYFGFSGNMDMSITIRSFYINNSALYFQAGAGIVADSNPKMELKETINKSGAMLKAINKTYE